MLNRRGKDMFCLSGNVRLNINTLDYGICDRASAVQALAVSKNLLNKVVIEITVSTTVSKE